MLYCTRCGKPVPPDAAFCSSCGARQPAGPSPLQRYAPSGSNFFAGRLSPSTASILCYVPFAGWIVAMFILATTRFRADRTARFHAFQGLYLFVVWMLVDIAAAAIFGFAGPFARRGIQSSLKLVVIGGWIFALIKTATGERVHLPFLGDLAESSVAEQFSGRP